MNNPESKEEKEEVKIPAEFSKVIKDFSYLLSNVGSNFMFSIMA